MNVLITGAYGFLGRNVALRFKEFGNYVAGIGHGKWCNEEHIQWGLDDWYETTITFEALLNINRKFDLIVHCGGSGSVAFSKENPYEDFRKSVYSTLALLEFIRLQNPDCKFIYPSSPAAQGNQGNIPIKEDMEGIPVSAYGFHKKIAEELCLSYHKNFNINIGIIRFFSIYGEGLKKQLLWDACMKIYQSNEVIFFGTGKETRDWIHISDAVELIYVFSNTLWGYDIINGGSGKSMKIEKVITSLCTHFKKPVQVTFNGKLKKGDPVYFWADINKALCLGWEPKVEIRNGLRDYVAYFKSVL